MMTSKVSWRTCVHLRSDRRLLLNRAAHSLRDFFYTHCSKEAKKCPEFAKIRKAPCLVATDNPSNEKRN
jgi:hypothetical protein